MSVNMTARCMKCRQNVDVVNHKEDGSTAGVVDVSKDPTKQKLALVGWCPVCQTKCFRFLSKTKDLDLIQAFGIAIAGTAPDVPIEDMPVEMTGTDAGKSAKVLTPSDDEVKEMEAEAKEPKKRTRAKPAPKPQPKAVTPKKAVGRKAATPPAKPKKVAAKPAPKSKTKEVKKMANTQVAEVNASFPMQIFAVYKGETVKAIMKAVDAIKYQGEIYSSVSLAASAVTGKSVNGWKFWHFKAADGSTPTINELRDQAGVKKVERKEKAEVEDIPTYPPIVLPEGCKLPRKNGPKGACIVCIDPKLYKKSAKFTGYAFADGVLLRIPYDKKGVGDKANIKKLGKFATWKEALVKAVADAAKNNLVQVKFS